ncbi:hypothetical protein DL240_07810 [Lujinxingia litoralis]|uniref:Bifunctional uridylyltransferase/uridylyl-removing enzyme n=1 Tax=Lujinxingia litoralis TaxID=2211119 RepID=A0A328C5M5_9DELT|nr:ACT domain-containing protein [Lujinxingia litoralis]RAL22789.1 hypothetical protein DL240_07810 [Lujinxingia litoralis]
MTDPGPLAIPEAVAQANAEVMASRHNIARAIVMGAGGLNIARRLRRVTDRWLITLWRHASSDQLREVASLHATGGYGRDELAYHSDIDVLIALNDEAWLQRPELALAVERLMAWSRVPRLRLSHAVRTPAQTPEALAEDPRTAIALIDLRPLCGPPSAAADRDAAIDHLRARDQGASFVEQLFEGHRQRVARHGQTVYLLEPDAKNGEGGLRDLNCISWAARTRWRLDARTQTRAEVGWDAEQRRRYVERLDAILATRNTLHLIHGRKSDRLTFADQELLVRLNELRLQTPHALEETHPDEIVARFRPRDEQDRQRLTPQVESLMRAYYWQARSVSVSCERMLRRWATTTPPASVQSLGSFELLGDQLQLPAEHSDVLNADEVFDALSLASHHDALLDPRLEAAIEAAVGTWPMGDETSPRRAARLRALLTSPTTSARTAQRLLDLGVLTRTLPEFDPLICHVQHDVYHVYTTDVHSLKCLELGRALLAGDPHAAGRWPFFAHVAGTITEREVFLLACLLHDIGKNRGGDHSRKGALLMESIGPRLGLEPPQVDLLAMLVREHLALSLTSRRRDLSDPHVIDDLAERLGDVPTLNLLTALTFCDMSTVAPDVMNDWNATLLMELYRRVREALEQGDLRHLADPRGLRRIRQRLERRVLDLSDAPVEPRDIDTFLHDLPQEHLLHAEPDALARQLAAYTRARRNDVETRIEGVAVEVAPLPDRGITEIIVSTVDTPGTLARIAGALSSAGVNIMSADIVSTASGRTLDIFHIAHFNPAALPVAEPRAVDDPRRIEKITSRIVDVLEERLNVDELLQQRFEESRLSPRPIPQMPTEVREVDHASEHFTVIEVRAPDRLGLLYQITRALWEAGVETRVSRIDSLGSQAIDNFYVEEAHGGKLDARRTGQVIDAISQALARLPES